MSDSAGVAPHRRLPRSAAQGYALAGTAVVVATIVAWAMFRFVEPANLVMTYLLAVVGVATRAGRGPSAFASVLSVATYDFFFVPPYFTFAVAEKHYVFTCTVMLVVALVISGLTDRIRRQADAAHHREQRTVALSAMSRELAEAGSVADLVDIATWHVGAVFGAEVIVVLPGSEGHLAVTGSSDARIADDTLELCRDVFARGRPAGLGTSTSGDRRATYLPLVGHRGPLGVIVVRPHLRDAFVAPEAGRQLETFVNQTALALERVRAAAEAQDARVRAETERLRSSLLTSVSHDLRTPLATITGAATAILDSGGRVDARTQVELLESIRDEADRLNRIVQNLLEMTRLESGTLQLRREWHPLEEVIGAALSQQAKRLGPRRVTINVPSDLPLVAIDDVLIEQLLVNLLDNAVKYTAPDTAIRVIATATDTSVTVELADGGRGLPHGEEDRVFEKFYRADGNGRRGAGLGLAICRSIVEAHGGRIWAQNLPEGGVAFLFTLPLTGTPPAPVPADA